MKFNGIDPCSLHKGISIAKEIPPGTVTSQLETVSGSTGEVVVGRTIKQGEYIVRVNIAGKYRAQAWEIRKLLAGWARGTDQATCELIPTHWPTVHYDAILKEISPPEFVFGFAVIDVVFAVPRPIAVDNMYQNAIGSEAGIVKPVIGGTSYARPTIIAFGRGVANLRLSVGTKVYFGLTGTLTSNERVKITTNPPSVQILSSVGDNAGEWIDANDRIDYTRTDFQRLAEAFAPGERTVMCYQASQINVEWRDEWL